LNGGDAGLKRFFERVHGALVPGGTFVFEAQPRESYIKARKLHPVRNIYPPMTRVLVDALSRNVDSAGECADIADTARGF
jgi:hypothetical protein